MARFVKGDMVVVPFPFSELNQAKRRTALVAASPSGDDLILCQITSQAVCDGYALALNDSDFRDGSLKQPGNIRPNRIFTADKRLILYRVGGLKQEKLEEVTQAIVHILRE